MWVGNPTDGLRPVQCKKAMVTYFDMKFEDISCDDFIYLQISSNMRGKTGEFALGLHSYEWPI